MTVTTYSYTHGTINCAFARVSLVTQHSDDDFDYPCTISKLLRAHPHYLETFTSVVLTIIIPLGSTLLLSPILIS